MVESFKVKSKYQVYDPIVNLTRIFKNKAEADEFAEEINQKIKPKTEENDNAEN